MKTIKKGNTKQKNQLGFTLVELMIAVLVAGITIAGYIGANIAIQRNAEEAFQRTVATQDAHQVIERMRDVAQTGTFPKNVTDAFPQRAAVTGFTNLKRELVLVEYNGGADAQTANPLDVTVTVSWTTYTGRSAATTVLRTYITQR